MTELKPCPFCGSTDVHLVDNDPGKSEVSITCKDCNVWVDHMFDAMSREEAIALWNRRVHDPIEELRQNAPLPLTYEQMERYYYGHVRPFDVNTEGKE